MVYPDFDEFQSHNPNAVFHAIARAINNGPIYITDKMGEQKFDVLFPLVYSDGKILRSGTALLPAEDCLFQVQDARPFKAYSLVGNSGLLGVWNCADADSVTGTFSASDVHSLRGDTCALYEYFSGEVKIVARTEKNHITLPRLGYKLYYVVPLAEGSAVFGLVNKYNAPASVVKQTIARGRITATLYEGGTFAASTPRVPKSVTVNGKKSAFTYHNSLVVVKIPVAKPRREATVELEF
jgi:raffinose synthase